MSVTTQPSSGLLNPPSDPSAEISVLGAMLLSKDAIAEVLETLNGADFYNPAHQAVYEAVLDLYASGSPADAVTVAAHLSKKGELERVGGASFIHSLPGFVPTSANANYYAHIVADLALRRRLVTAGTRITSLGYSTSGETDQVVDSAQAEVFAVTGNRLRSDYLPLGEAMDPTIALIETLGNSDDRFTGVPTGFAELDEVTGGFQPGQMVMLAARPSIGKSTLAMDVMRAASVTEELTSVIFSLEMSRTEIVMRLLSAQSQVPLQRIRSGSLGEGEWVRLSEAVSSLQTAPLFIDDSPNLSLMEIRAKCRRLKQQHNLSLVVVDYLQLLSSSRKVESRQQEVSEFSRSLKLLAKELELPVLAVSQLNRGPEQRADKRPLLSDLRESGALEQDADVVILLNREDYYDKDSPRAGEADLILAKHRNGPTRTVTVAFQGHYSRFVEMNSV